MPCNRERQRLANLRHRALPGYKGRKSINDKKYRRSEKAKEMSKAYHKKNRKKMKNYHKAYSEKWAKTVVGKTSLKRARDKCYYKDIEKSRKAGREFYYRRKQDIRYRIHDAISSSIYDALLKNKNGRTWETLVDFTLSDLMVHLKKLFLLGMSWDNYGQWHIDHIIPRSRFRFSSVDDSEFKKCWALDNLQPLWAIDNIKKWAH